MDLNVSDKRQFPVNRCIKHDRYRHSTDETGTNLLQLNASDPRRNDGKARD
jgi:hypothetical protein